MNTDNFSNLEKFWTDHVASWQETDLTQRAYCQKHELPVHRFGYWKRKLTEPTEQLPAVQGFIQLNPMTSAHSGLIVQLPNQLRIEGIASDNLYLVKQLSELLQ